MQPQFVTCITLEGTERDVKIVQIEQIVLEGDRCASSFDRDEPLFFVIDYRTNHIRHLGPWAECDEWIDQLIDDLYRYDRYSIIPVEERME
jgi:hypothetical protein